VVEGHLIAGLGRHKLRSLTPEPVDAFLKAKADAGLSKRYVGRMRSVLTDALTHAERRSLVSRNASRLSIMPACTPTPEPRSLTQREAEAFIAAAQSHRLGAMLTAMVVIGIRPGEATGLLWSDLDFHAGGLAITGSTKRVLARSSLRRHVADNDRDRRFVDHGTELVDHRLGQLDTGDRYASAQKRHRHPAGPYGEFEGSAITGEPGQAINGRVQHFGGKHAFTWRVVALSGVGVPDVLLSHEPDDVSHHLKRSNGFRGRALTSADQRLASRAIRGTSTTALGLPQPVTGSQPDPARYPVIVS
jgi:integrase